MAGGILSGFLNGSGNAPVTQPMTQEQVTNALNGLSTQQIRDAVDYETPSDKENQDWLKYLQGQYNKPADKSAGLLSGKNAWLYVGGLAVIGILIILSLSGKK